MSTPEARKGKSDLPAPMTTSNGQVASLTQPWNALEIKQSLQRIGGKLRHVGGALPPLFPINVKEGDAQLVRYLGFETISAAKAGGKEGFTCLNFDVMDHTKKDLPPVYRAQLVLTTSLETYFKVDEKTGLPMRDAEKTPLLVITYAGSVTSKKSGFNSFKRWIVEEFTPDKN